SWDEMYDILSDAIIEAIEEEGPQTCSITQYHQGNFMVGGEYSAFQKIWNMDATYGPGGCFSDLQIGCQATMGDTYHTLINDPMESKCILIWGENDTATPMRDARIIERLVPGAGLVSFPGCGHYSFLDNPVQFAAVLNSFLQS
ncbi:MAG: alpha/beta hydrolase, partial [Paramuribaculum sp.]